MRTGILAVLAVFALGCSGSGASSDSQVSEEDTGPYDIVANWPEWIHPFPRPGYTWGSQGGVFAETPQKIFLANRGELKLPENVPPSFSGAWPSLGQQQATQPVAEFRNCIVVVDGNGKLLASWTQWDHLFEWGRGPHAIRISPHDPERHVWVVDDMMHQVHKFTNDGKRLVMTLGQRGEFGNDNKHFDRPTDLAWLPEGTFFVSDGYVNTRVVKFDKNGNYLMDWGTRGTGPGQFNTVHGIAVGRDRRVYVSDRGNRRIQVFDENGKFLHQWPGIGGGAHTIMMSGDQYLWAFDGATDQVVKYSLNGRVEFAWGKHGTAPGQFWAGHQMSADADGNLYVAEVFGGRTQKFRPAAGADPAKLVRPEPLM